MYDIPELEKKWRKYKRNQIKKPLILTVASIAILSGITIFAYTYLNNKSSNKIVANKTTEENSNEKTNNITNNQNGNSNSPAIVITRESDKTKANSNVSNSTNSLVNVKPTQQVQTEADENSIDISKATIIKPNVPDDEIRVIGFDKNEKEEIKDKYADILIPKQSTQDIQEREKIAELEDRFKTSQDPKDSLEIAKYYYQKGNYKKAENWAVNTNNIDGDLEDSWLIFAKSRAKQGFRTDAIKVLQSFYDETNSVKAKALLDDIRRGKPFK